MWFIFFCIIAILLIIDLGVFNKKDHEIGVKESLLTSAFYILISLIFSIFILHKFGINGFAEYITGFLIEKTLAIDNIFLISIIFSTFSIPLKYQHRVLFFGIIGVIALRAVMLIIGIKAINKFNWILYLFGILLIVTGIKMLIYPDKKIDIKNNKLIKVIKKYLNTTDTLHKQKFFIYQKNKKNKKKQLFITPLFLSLIAIEFVDLIFAFDSIPAILSITQNSYIVYTSNIFAILGLRALYFAIIAVISSYYYIKHSLAMILIFIGSKMFIADILNIEKISPVLSLTVTITILIFGIIASIAKKLFKNKKNKIL